MKHLFTIFILFSFICNKIYCQMPPFIYPNPCTDEYIGFGYACNFRNSAVLAKALIEVLEEDSVKEILDNYYFNISYTIDDCGFVVNTNDTQNYLGRFISKQTLKKIEVALHNDSARFQDCYRNEFNIDEITLKKSIYKWNSDNRKNTHLVRAYSPIILIDKNYYDIELKQNPHLTKYDYLLMQIKKYSATPCSPVQTRL